MTQISAHINYIGVDDHDLDLFESQYRIPEGISYNSYLIVDDKVAVMDTVDACKKDQWLQQLQAGLQGRRPDYLVMHHVEPDHAGAVASLLERYPALQVVATAKALQMLPQFFEGLDLTGRSLAVKEGDTLPLGSHTLQFFSAPMVHWPEVMVS
ncbi:MAG: MBL fold metallo-hydrolase, partial [Bacteroidales bacterium]|nr:MBL fold metallo-hydrolase [Bacteroidales bacterium]